jgi:serine/threonine-protein kinase
MRSDLVRVRGGQAPLAPSVMSADERTAMMAPGPPTGSTRRINGRVPPPPQSDYGDYYADEEPPRRAGRVVAIVAGVLVVLGLVGFVAYQLLSGPATPSQIAVPGVVGQSQQDASNQIIAAGLRVGNVVQQESPVEQVGKVINSNPAAGVQVAERSNVDLTVGSGPAFVNVPALQGMSVADATALLKSQGLVLGKQTNQPTNDSTQVGKVVNSSPGPGQRVKGGSPVDIAVGTQQTALTVPDVTGQDKDDAKKALQAKGFEVDTNTVDGGGQKDSVLSTDPPAGTQAQPGSKVTMNVSKGNKQNQMPNVVGQTLASAAQNLASAGYTNLAVQGSRDPNSIVVDQNPSDSDTSTDKRIVLTTQSSGGGGNGANGLGLLN